MYIVVAGKYTTLLVLHWLFNYMALKAMCKYSILLTPSPSRESPTLQQPYWYRSLVTESSTLSMRTLPSEYGARVGLVSVEPPSLSQGGGAMMELVIADGWFVRSSTTQSPVSWTLSTVIFGGQDSTWSGPSHVSISLVGKCYCAPFWPEHVPHTLLFWPHG